MKFKCDNCGKETNVGESIIDLTCQGCGGFDLRFDCAIEALPLIEGHEWGKEVVVEKEESFCGKHSQGSLWKVKRREDLDALIPPVFPETEKQVKKANLVKAVRKLKTQFEKKPANNSEMKE